MPETYAYKVRDRGGKLISGTLVADNEALVLQRLREQGYTPLEVGKQKRGLQRRDRSKPRRSSSRSCRSSRGSSRR